MKNTLPFLKSKFFAFMVLLMFSKIGNTQNLKTQVTPKKIVKGHALYKQTKIYDSKFGATEKKPRGKADNALDRMKYEYERLRNPYTGRIPEDIKEREVSFSKRIARKPLLKTANRNVAQRSSGDFYYWKNRGPFNVGGRTRALAIDRTNENIILAGGVSGGIWRSEDAGKTWRRAAFNKLQPPSVTAIVQDPRPRKSHIWYYGTGERSGNSPSARKAFYTGTGIYKSIDGGRTWFLLRSTSGDIRPILPFHITNSIAVNPANGDLYVATFKGLHRSKDGGRTFTEVLKGGTDNRVEVSITSKGVIYATIESDGKPNAGFFTSTDGDTWKNITPSKLKDFSRTVMGINPSNENEVYFFSKNSKESPEAFLFKYNAIEKDSSKNRWTDLTTNLPSTIGGSVGNLNLQGGYNMLVKVHPKNDSIVFIGGTNLYRSITAFTTPAGQESWIGGYSPKNDISVYTNQHPDEHALVFYPSNPNKVLSGNDGGIFLTEDITATNAGAEPVTWQSLNNGYLTTQPYHVSFDPEANSDDLLAGFQDNGTWFTNSTDSKKPWVEDFGGDGSYSAIADGGRTRYVSAQRGYIFRLNFDKEGKDVSFSRVTPASASGFSFINPFVLDPVNDNIMYMPVGNTVWRNNDLDGLPLNVNRPTDVNWVALRKSSTKDGSAISALDISKFPVANRLYYGTSTGGVYKIDNANVDEQEAIDISTGKGLPPGYVNDINVDPSNPDRVIITFSNYGIKSLFLTEDAGETWVNISGNLEEKKDGSGNGPSVRSTAFFGSSTGVFGGISQKVFAATSTGLYYTSFLNGENTLWVKEIFVIGNAVADEVKTRKDGFVALASHGNGLFSAKFPLIFNELPEPTLKVSSLLKDYSVFENSKDTVINIKDLFTHSKNKPIDVKLKNSNTNLISAHLQKNDIKISYKPDSLGVATISLVATAGNEQVSEGFTITVREKPVFEQVNTIVNSNPSQNFLDFRAIAQTADDFSVPQGSTWKVNRILAFGGENNTPTINSATVVIFSDVDGKPGEEVYNSGVIQIASGKDPNLNIVLPKEVVLTSGNYWLSIYANLAFNPNQTQWFWLAQEGSAETGEAVFKDEADLFGKGAKDWTKASKAFTRKPVLDQVFQIFGDIEDDANQASRNSSSEAKKHLANVQKPLTNLHNNTSFVVFPNPSTDRFLFKFDNKLDEKAVVSVYKSSGELVFAKSNVNLNSTYEWNASKAAPGVYFVKIIGKNTNEVIKLIKE